MSSWDVMGKEHRGQTYGPAPPGPGSSSQCSGLSTCCLISPRRKLLKTALTSLETLHEMYETRERRWREEEMRLREEREGMDVLLQQAFGAYLKAQPDP